MKIGVDASHASTTKKTGIDNVVYQIILHLQDYDKENEYILYTNKQLDSKLSKNKNFTERMIPLRRLWHKFRLPLALLRDKPDVFLELTSSVPPFSGGRNIVLIHDFAFKYFPKAYSKEELIIQELAIKADLERADTVLLTSKANKDDFLKFYGEIAKNKKIEIVPLAFDNTIFKPQTTKQETDPYFISLGRLEERKNTKKIIGAFELFKKETGKKHKLFLIGFPGFGYKKIKKIIESSPFKDDIIETGYVEDKKLVSLLSSASALIYPSLYEGFGLPMLEAFACKTPVVILNIPTLTEIAGSAAFVAEANTNEAIYKKMCEAINPELSLKRITEGVMVASKYSWDETAKKIINIIKK